MSAEDEATRLAVEEHARYWKQEAIARLRETGHLVLEEPDGTLIVKPIKRKD